MTMYHEKQGLSSKGNMCRSSRWEAGMQNEGPCLNDSLLLSTFRLREYFCFFLI